MSRFITQILFASSIFWFGISSPCLAEQIQTQPANLVAKKWLALIDADKFDESWKEAASPFKDFVTGPDWQKSLTEARDVLGKLLKRKLKSEHFTTTIPNGPSGKYVIIEYNCTFENKKKVLETITPMLEKDGHWRVSGYFLSFQK